MQRGILCREVLCTRDNGEKLGRNKARRKQSQGKFDAAGGWNMSSSGALDSLLLPKPALGVEGSWMGQRDQTQAVIFNFRSESGLGLKAP